MMIAQQFFIISRRGFVPFDCARVCTCVCRDEAREVDGFGFMAITFSQGVRNQSNANPNARLASPPAISKVGIDSSTQSCLMDGQTKETQRGEMERW